MSEPVKDVTEEKKEEKTAPQEDKAAELTKYKVCSVFFPSFSCRK